MDSVRCPHMADGYFRFVGLCVCVSSDVVRLWLLSLTPLPSVQRWHTKHQWYRRKWKFLEKGDRICLSKWQHLFFNWFGCVQSMLPIRFLPSNQRRLNVYDRFLPWRRTIFCIQLPVSEGFQFECAVHVLASHIDLHSKIIPIADVPQKSESLKPRSYSYANAQHKQAPTNEHASHTGNVISLEFKASIIHLFDLIYVESNGCCVRRKHFRISWLTEYRTRCLFMRIKLSSVHICRIGYGCIWLLIPKFKNIHAHRTQQCGADHSIATISRKSKRRFPRIWNFVKKITTKKNRRRAPKATRTIFDKFSTQQFSFGL